MTGRLKRCIKEAQKAGVRNKVILDVGCSIGWFCGVAVDLKAKEVWGIDPNKGQIETARKQNIGAKFKVASAGKLPFGSKKFDLVTLLDVIEHIPKNTEPQTLKEIYRVLKPGGKLLISTPNDNLFAKITDPAWYFGHRHYSKSGLSKLLKGVGFKVKTTKTYGGIWEIIGIAVLYVSKWIFRTDMPLEEWFDEKRTKEFNKKGFTHLMITSQKPK